MLRGQCEFQYGTRRIAVCEQPAGTPLLELSPDLMSGGPEPSEWMVLRRGQDGQCEISCTGQLIVGRHVG